MTRNRFYSSRRRPLAKPQKPRLPANSAAVLLPIDQVYVRHYSESRVSYLGPGGQRQGHAQSPFLTGGNDKLGWPENMSPAVDNKEWWSHRERQSAHVLWKGLLVISSGDVPVYGGARG